MAQVQYSSRSPYSETNQVLQNPGYLDIWEPKFIVSSDGDEIFVVTGQYVHRPDLIATRFYGTPEFWWVFISRNVDIIKDPIYDLVEGLEIRIPSLANIERS